MSTITTITIILGLVLVIVAIMLMTYAVWIYIQEEKRNKRPLTSDEIKTLVSLQPNFEEADKILNKHVADNTTVKLSWIMNQFNIYDLSSNLSTEDEYKRVLKGIISRE